MNKYVVVDDGQTSWIADKAKLIAAMNDLGWEKIDGGRRCPGTTQEEKAEAYSALCNAVPGIEGEATDDMKTLMWSEEQDAWLW